VANALSLSAPTAGIAAKIGEQIALDHGYSLVDLLNIKIQRASPRPYLFCTTGLAFMGIFLYGYSSGISQQKMILLLTSSMQCSKISSEKIASLFFEEIRKWYNVRSNFQEAQK